MTEMLFSCFELDSYRYSYTCRYKFFINSVQFATTIIIRYSIHRSWTSMVTMYNQTETRIENYGAYCIVGVHGISLHHGVCLFYHFVWYNFVNYPDNYYLSNFYILKDLTPGHHYTPACINKSIIKLRRRSCW